jgi:hypothetical protein
MSIPTDIFGIGCRPDGLRLQSFLRSFAPGGSVCSLGRMIFIRFHNHDIKFIRLVNKTMPAVTVPGAIRLRGNCGIDFTAGEKYVQERVGKFASVLLHLFQPVEQVFEPVKPDLVHQPELLPQLTRREALGMIPYQVMLGQVAKQYILVFSIRHFILYQAQQYFFVEYLHGRNYENQQVSRGLKFFSIFDDAL